MPAGAPRTAHNLLLGSRGPPRPALLRYVGLRDAGLGSVRGGHSWTRKGVALGCDLTVSALDRFQESFVAVDVFRMRRKSSQDPDIPFSAKLLDKEVSHHLSEVNTTALDVDRVFVGFREARMHNDGNACRNSFFNAGLGRPALHCCHHHHLSL